ncbi:protein boule-like [Aplochiton taeniatus]
MEKDNETTMTCTQTQTSTPSPSPDPVTPDHSTTTTPNSNHAPRFGTVIPNRIFVGGIDFKTNENDLRRFFSQHGTVKEVKIVIDRAGVSKGYGFVTFETQEDAQKLLHEADRLFFRDKKINIGQAIRKQQVGGHTSSFSLSSGSHAQAVPAPCSTMYLTTPTGYPYTYHNGVAYFHTPEMAQAAPHWPPRPVSGSSVLLSHPPQQVFQPPACHHYQVRAAPCQRHHHHSLAPPSVQGPPKRKEAPPQCVPGHVQWNVPQTPVPSSPVLYMQPSEYLYQPVEQSTDGTCVQPALPVMEATVPEQFMDHLVQPTYHQVYAQSPGGVTPIIMQQEPGKEQKFHGVRRGFPSSPVGLKPRYGRNPHYALLRKDHHAEPSEQPGQQPTAFCAELLK